MINPSGEGSARRMFDPEVVEGLKPLVRENNTRARDRMYAARDTEPNGTDEAERALAAQRAQAKNLYQQKLKRNELGKLHEANWELGQEGKDAAIAHIEARKSGEEAVRSKGIVSRVRSFLKVALNR